MGFMQNLFTSPREREGKTMFGSQNKGYDDILNEIGSMQSAYQDPGAIDETSALVQRMIAPGRRSLGTRLGRSRAAAAERMSTRSAMPEMTFGNIESSYAPAFADLEASGMSQLGNILGRRDQFSQNKMGMRMQGMQGKTQAIQNYLSSLSEDSTFDDILGAVGTGAKVAGGLGWNPFAPGKK